MQANLKNMWQRWDKAKQTKLTTFWIAMGAIIITLILGFSRGGWMLPSNAQTLADRAAANAVVERLAPICVAQFLADPSNAQNLEELQALTTSTRRSTYVRDGGWAIMPGESNSDSRVAAQCAQQLMLIDE